MKIKYRSLDSSLKIKCCFKMLVNNGTGPHNNEQPMGHDSWDEQSRRPRHQTVRFSISKVNGVIWNHTESWKQIVDKHPKMHFIYSKSELSLPKLEFFCLPEITTCTPTRILIGFATRILTWISCIPILFEMLISKKNVRPFPIIFRFSPRELAN